MSKGISQSFKFSPSVVEQLSAIAKAKNISKTEIVKQCIEAHISTVAQSDAKAIVKGATKNEAALRLARGGVVSNTDDIEDMKMLKHIGVASIGGITGYYISKAVREHLEMKKNKDMDILIGLISGLGIMVYQAMSKK